MTERICVVCGCDVEDGHTHTMSGKFQNEEIARLRDLVSRLRACQIYTQGAEPVHWRRSCSLEAEVVRTAIGRREAK